MDINLDYYKIFHCVASRHSFSKAAKELYISQPAVSQSIKQLETSLQTKLFIRESKGVSLTGDGKILFGHVDSALNLLHSGEDKLAKRQELLAGEIKIGAADTITKHLLMDSLHGFHAQFPDIKISVTNRTTTELIDLLKKGEVDFTVVNLPVSDSSLSVINCLEVHDIFIAPKNFADLKGKRLSLSELSRYPLILLEPIANSRRIVEEHFMSNGVPLKPEIELGAYDLLVLFAKIGLGISCVIREFSVREINGEDLFEIQLDKPVPSRHVGVCYLKNIPLSPAAKAFIGILTSEVRQKREA